MRAALRSIALAALLLSLPSSCVLRAPIPAPVTPLLATERSEMAAPPSERWPEDPFAMRLVRRELDNGMRVIISRGAPNGIASVVFVSRGLAQHDPRASVAVTELTAGTLFRRTRLEDGTEAEDLLDREGYGPQVELLPDGLRVSARLQVEELPRYVTSLARAVREPVYRDDDLSLVLLAHRERLSGSLLTVDGVVEERLPRLLYETGDPRAANREARLAAGQGVDAAALAERHRHLIDPRACALVVTGDVDPAQILPLVSEPFSDLEARVDTPSPPEPRYRADGARGIVIPEPLIRSYIVVRERAPPLGHEDHAAFLILEQLLGGMFGAQLNLTLREETTASYGFHASYRADGHAGELELSTATDPRQTQPAVEMVLRELARVRGENGGLERFELDLAKTRARELLMARLDHLPRAREGARRA